MRRGLVLLLALGPLGACGAWVPRIAPTESRGLPTRGYLLGGRALPDRGTGFERVRPGEPTRWGTPTLLEAVTTAAAEVARRHPGGHPLLVGDLSLPGGGRHPRHRSHRTGRDVDLLPFWEDGWGRPTRPPARPPWWRVGPLTWRFGVDARPLARLDVRRTWTLVRSLLRTAPVQWIFCAAPMKRALLRHAARVEPDARVLARAAWVLHTPRTGRRHDDHLHVRVARSLGVQATGCLDAPPHWPWLRGPDDTKGSWPGPRPTRPVLARGILRPPADAGDLRPRVGSVPPEPVDISGNE